MVDQLPRIQRLEVDAMNIHSFIRAEDEIYFFYEYTAGMNFAYSDGNGIVSNLKKDVIKFGHNPQIMRHKTRAIQKCSELISSSLNPAWLASATLVPVPPSKLPGEPEYDDRMLQVVRGVRIRTAGQQPLAQAAELVTQTMSLRKSHESEPGARPSIKELLDAYQVNSSAVWEPPQRIVVVDDMLTTGRHFRAMKQKLEEAFPSVEIVGVFISRRVFADPQLAFQLDL